MQNDHSVVKMNRSRRNSCIS